MKALLPFLIPALAITLFLPASHGGIVISAQNNSDDVSRTVTVSNDGGVNGTYGESGANAGDWVGSGNWTGGVSGDNFNFTLSTASNWSDGFAADEATYENYVTNLLVAADEIDNASSSIGVNSTNTLGVDNATNRISQTGEALYLTIDSTSLDPTSSLRFNGIGLQQRTSADEPYTLVFHDASADTVFTVVNSNSNASALGLDFELDAGDSIILAMGAGWDGTNAGFRMANFQVDMITLIPEPSSFLILPILGLLSLLTHRRRSTL